MVSLGKAKAAVRQARESIDTSVRLAAGAIVLAVLAVLVGLVALVKAGRLAHA